METLAEFDFVYLVLTARCNLQCRYCYATEGPFEVAELDMPQTKAFLKQFSLHGGREIQLTGGEPLMREDLGEIISAASELELKLSMITNGTLLTLRSIDHLATHGVGLTLSLDGDEDLHDKLRGRPGAFRETMAAVRNLCAREAPFGIQCMIVPPAWEAQLNWLESFTQSYTPRYIRLSGVSPLGRGEACADLVWPESQSQVLLDATRSLARRTNYHTLVVANVMAHEERDYFYSNFDRCVKPWIMPNGDIYPFLTGERQWRMGNVRHYPSISHDVLEASRALITRVYEKALHLDYIHLFDLIANEAKEAAAWFAEEADSNTRKRSGS